MNVVEYDKKYEKDVKLLLKELQEYIVSIDPYHFNIIDDNYEDKIFIKDMEEVNKNIYQKYLIYKLK